jgi:hypothetical protein
MKFARPKLSIALLICVILLSVGLDIPLQAQSPQQMKASLGGPLTRWHRLALTVDGPNTSEDAAVNPFTDIRLDVIFTHAKTGERYRVPGFYAADGRAGRTSATAGNKWRAYFAPPRTGQWTYRALLYRGEDAALADVADLRALTPARRATGAFTVRPHGKNPEQIADFRAKGMLRYVGGHHMRFAGSGEYFLRLGLGSPENFLAYADFDGTFDTGGILPDFLHEYAVHEADWRPGDPTWGGGAGGSGHSKGKGIIGALNFLAGQGVNSLYFLTYNLDGGDGMDVWPWTTPDERLRFDVSKLDQWEIVFTHAQRLGVELHLFTQENENDRLLGGDSTLNAVRKLYYRELVARFAHHPALQWNIGEENANSTAEQLEFAAYLRALDPYDHPIAIHSFYNLTTQLSGGTPDIYFDPLLNAASPNFDAASIQGNSVNYNRWAIDLRARSAAAGRPWAIYGDEQGPAVAADMSNVALIVRQGAWGNLMGGGAGVAWYFGYQGDFGDLQQEEFISTAPLWAATRPAFDFFRAHLPFWAMTPDNARVGGGAQVLALPGRAYAVFFPSGVTGRPNALDLGDDASDYAVRWYDPLVGGALQPGTVNSVSGPGSASLGEPPREAGRAWAAVLKPAGSPSAALVNPSRPLRDFED